MQKSTVIGRFFGHFHSYWHSWRQLLAASLQLVAPTATAIGTPATDIVLAMLQLLALTITVSLEMKVHKAKLMNTE